MKGVALRGLAAAMLAAFLLAGCRDSGTSSTPDACKTVEVTRWQEAWKADVACMSALIEKVHPDPWHHVSKADFEAEAAALENDLPQLDQAQAIARFLALVALINDVHTALGVPARLMPAAPVRFESFEDGTWLLAADGAQADAVGRRLATVNGLPVADVMQALAPLEPAETPAMRPYRLARRLAYPQLLWAQGVAGRADSSEAVLEGRSAPLHLDSTDTRPADSTSPDPERTDLPISFTRHDENYWAENIPGLRLLYVQFNLSFADATYPVNRFVEDVVALLDTGDVDRVLIDLRNNRGGIVTMMTSLRTALTSHAVSGAPGAVLVAIGPGTYSASVQHAIELRDEAGALLIGNATTELANHFGAIEYATLPNTGMELRISSEYLENDPGNDGPLQPDITLPRRGVDYTAGIDPVLEWFESN